MNSSKKPTKGRKQATTKLPSTRIVVVGLGKSGVAAARLCSRYGARVTATDAAPLDRLSDDARALAKEGVEIVAGGHAPDGLLEAALVVVSPGVPAFPELEAAERAGVPVIGEVELASHYLPSDIAVVAITGSNGKSTTVTLVGELLSSLGARTFVGGNLGDPPCAIVPLPPLASGTTASAGAPAFRYDEVVLEISSFQSERIPTFHPARAALLNVSPNHLDRYADYDAYVAAKGNLFVNQTASDAAVVPADEPACIAQARRGSGRVLLFGPASCKDATYTFDRNEIVDRERGLRFSRSRVRLPGDHNAKNICAALALIAHRSTDPDMITDVLERFEGLPHRIVRVATAAGVTYYDDSKGTNVGATVAAVRGLSEEKVVLIAGGRDKMGSYEPLVEALRDRGRGAVLIGEAADRIAEAVGSTVAVERAASMQDAVSRAARLAKPGDAVLLSPACSSFDMFRDYKARGDAFVSAVRELPMPPA